ncbi:MAG: hypothetical protein GY913_26605 [Proteobacteria bacterium]|nr:hypothetical protein [Pseudomonadota bacterium]
MPLQPCTPRGQVSGDHGQRGERDERTSGGSVGDDDGLDVERVQQGAGVRRPVGGVEGQAGIDDVLAATRTCS